MEIRVQLVRKDLRVTLAHRGRRAFREIPDRRVHKARRGLLGQPARRAHKGRPDWALAKPPN